MYPISLITITIIKPIKTINNIKIDTQRWKNSFLNVLRSQRPAFPFPSSISFLPPFPSIFDLPSSSSWIPLIQRLSIHRPTLQQEQQHYYCWPWRLMYVWVRVWLRKCTHKYIHFNSVVIFIRIINILTIRARKLSLESWILKNSLKCKQRFRCCRRRKFILKSNKDWEKRL